MSRNRRHLTVLVVGVALLAAACGSTSSGSTKSTTTATTKAVTTTSAATTTTEPTTTTTSDPFGGETTEPGGPTTTEVKAPVGDEKLIPLLLETADFGANLTPGSSSLPDETFCAGHPFATKWQASANTSVDSTSANSFAGGAESILEFATGDATKFMAEFPALSAACAAAEDGPGVVLKPVGGYGDEALRGTSDASDEQSLPLDVLVVRVGDQVIVLFSLDVDGKSLLTDALVGKAIAKVKAG